jgi:hypothetical protein
MAVRFRTPCARQPPFKVQCVNPPLEWQCDPGTKLLTFACCGTPREDCGWYKGTDASGWWWWGWEYMPELTTGTITLPELPVSLTGWALWASPEELETWGWETECCWETLRTGWDVMPNGWPVCTGGSRCWYWASSSTVTSRASCPILCIGMCPTHLLHCVAIIDCLMCCTFSICSCSTNTNTLHAKLASCCFAYLITLKIHIIYSNEWDDDWKWWGGVMGRPRQMEGPDCQMTHNMQTS